MTARGTGHKGCTHPNTWSDRERCRAAQGRPSRKPRPRKTGRPQIQRDNLPDGTPRVQCAYKMSPDTKERLNEAADYLLMSRSELVETAVLEYLERNAL